MPHNHVFPVGTKAILRQREQVEVVYVEPADYVGVYPHLVRRIEGRLGNSFPAVILGLQNIDTIKSTVTDQSGKFSGNLKVHWKNNKKHHK
jgi:hypothetical protein